MPMNRSLYPANWNQIALQIKEAANWTCQECGRPCRRPGQEWMEFVMRLGVLSPWYEQTCSESKDGQITEHPQRFTLTVAHLNHTPSDCSPENLKALCAPCHCRYDAPMKAARRKAGKERQGQLSLL